MSVIQNNLLLAGDDAYNIQRSLRFRSSASAYLNRTLTSSRTTATFSVWVKRGSLGGSQSFFGWTNGVDTSFGFRFASDQLELFSYTNVFVARRLTNAVYRDPSAWYHIVGVIDTTNATANNRLRVYVNGVEVTSFSASVNPAQNTNLNLGNGSSFGIGADGGSVSSYFDGYLTEINFIDGQALTPSSFGMNDPQTGVWEPIRYTGTYGTNGFYLPFSDNSSLSNLTADRSGNGNNWTANNISLTAGATYDSMTDVPTLTSATQANFAVLNPLDSGRTLSNANLTYAAAASGITKATFGVSSGKWYWEFTANGTECMVGICPITLAPTTSWIGSSAGGWGYFGGTGLKYFNGSGSSYGSSYTTGDVIGVAFDADNGTLTFYKNNVSQGTAFTGITGSVYCPANGNNSTNDSGSLNFGQRPFAYTPPTGFVALNTFNLPTPTIGATASTQADNYFDAKTYTGTGATQTITVDFSSDFAWLKRRDGAGENVLLDRLRLTGSLPNRLFSNSTAAESTAADGQNSFSSSGIVLDGTGGGGEVNTSGRTYVAWQWKANGTGVTNTAGSITSTVSANTTSGFSVVTYTGTGANATVGHGLGVAPKMIIIKNRTGVYNWRVWHTALSSTELLYLNTTDAKVTGQTTAWNSTLPSSTVFSLGSSGGVNESASTFVAYCFSEVAGYSKFGSYTGNGSSDGTFVALSFRPKFIMVKRTDSAGFWTMLDSSRSPFNVADDALYANASNAESIAQNVDFLSNGFKFRSTDSDTNSNGGTHVYMAFAENPFKFSLGR